MAGRQPPACWGRLATMMASRTPLLELLTMPLDLGVPKEIYQNDCRSRVGNAPRMSSICFLNIQLRQLWLRLRLSEWRRSAWCPTSLCEATSQEVSNKYRNYHNDMRKNRIEPTRVSSRMIEPGAAGKDLYVGLGALAGSRMESLTWAQRIAPHETTHYAVQAEGSFGI